MESRSRSSSKSVFNGSDCFYGVLKHRKMWAISRRLSIMVSKTKAQENLEQLQVSLCSILQGDPKIIEDLEDQRLCIKHTRCTSQCGNFYQNEAGPHPGAGECCNDNTSRQNIKYAADKNDIRAIDPIRHPHIKGGHTWNKEWISGGPTE